jgi:hypothetical protein
MIRSAALGGLFIGVLSALPILGAANCCCCLWIVCGGALASYLETQTKNRSLTGGEGAAVGALAGVFGAMVWLPVMILIEAVFSPLQRAVLGEVLRTARDMPPEMRDMLESWTEPGTPLRIVFGFFLQLFIGTIFSAIGGLLGAMYFKKEVPPALGGSWIPPVPPQG